MQLFYSTEPAPCPYLPGRQERRLVTFLEGALAERRHELLVRHGFRRSQGIAYRTACPGCNACVPVRIPVARFRWRRTYRRIWRHNADLVAEERPPRATIEQYRLFRRYLESRHPDGGMADMAFDGYRVMVEDTPLQTLVVELRDAAGRLVACSLTDRSPTALSGVYKFFDPDQAARSLGSHVILWHVHRAQEQGLEHVYLGYWIAESPKMAYKARFQPLERLTTRGWEPLEARAPVADAVAAK
jgi:leucyl-tRNA---protein transferase